MSLTISPQIRIVALVGILAAAGFFVWMTMFAGGGEATAAAPRHLNRHPFGTAHVARKPVTAKPGAAKAKAKAKAKPPAKSAPLAAPTLKKAPVVKKTVVKKTVVVKKVVVIKKQADPKPVTPADGLPVAISNALKKSPVVVALLFNPSAKVDAASAGEAAAGAHLAGVGFVPVNVLVKDEVQALTDRYNVLVDPAVLVFRRPGVLVTQFNGFADRETVAQAAQNAR